MNEPQYLTNLVAPSGAQATPAVKTVKPVGPDFCLVQLTAAGVTAAGDYPLRYSNGRQQFVFQPGVPQKPVKVARYEWELALAPHTTVNGQALFEIVTPENATKSNAISMAADKIPGTVATPIGPEISKIADSEEKK
jgi:hypothetical protein